jgi:hypothetical protein
VVLPRRVPGLPAVLLRHALAELVVLLRHVAAELVVLLHHVPAELVGSMFPALLRHHPGRLALPARRLLRRSALGVLAVPLQDAVVLAVRMGNGRAVVQLADQEPDVRTSVPS